MQERKVTWNKSAKLFPNKWKRKLAKCGKGQYYNDGKWINEHEFGKVGYYNEYYDDDLDLVATDKSSCSAEFEAESHNDSVLHDIIIISIIIIVIIISQVKVPTSCFQSKNYK